MNRSSRNSYLRERRLLARQPERPGSPERSPASSSDLSSDEPDSSVESIASRRRSRREQRERLEQTDRFFEQMTDAEIYHWSKNLTGIIARQEEQLSRIDEKREPERFENAKLRLAGLQERIAIARTLRAERNGWSSQPVVELEERLAEEQADLQVLESRMSPIQEAVRHPNSPTALAIKLPAGLELNDLLRIYHDDRVELLNNIGTINQVLDSPGD